MTWQSAKFVASPIDFKNFEQKTFKYEKYAILNSKTVCQMTMGWEVLNKTHQQILIKATKIVYILFYENSNIKTFKLMKNAL